VLFGKEYASRLRVALRPNGFIGFASSKGAGEPVGPFVVGVDPGTREFAAGLYDVGADSLLAVYWCDLLETMALRGTNDLTETVNYVMRQRPHVFRRDAMLVIESQPRHHTDNCCVEATVRSYYHDRGAIMTADAKKLKKYFEAVRGTVGRGAKKLATREYTKSILKPHERALFERVRATKASYRREAIAIARELGETEPAHLTTTLVDQHDVFATIIMCVEEEVLKAPIARRRVPSSPTTTAAPVVLALPKRRRTAAPPPPTTTTKRIVVLSLDEREDDDEDDDDIV
jgi:hypothetical protein